MKLRVQAELFTHLQRRSQHHDSKMDGMLLNHGSLDERCTLDDGRGRW
jgi:hypothetical protein